MRSGGVVADSGGPFDLINGLPVHPLVVHAAVVLVPLAGLGVLLMVVWPGFSRRLGWLVAGVAVAAAGASVVAKVSGEALEERVGEPGFDHADLGEVMPIFAAVLALATLVLWLVDRSGGEDGPRRGVRIGTAVVAAVVALASLFWVFRVGDSGAKSVWSGRISATVDPGAGADGTDGGEDGDGEDDDDDDDDEGAEDDDASPDPSETPSPEGTAGEVTYAPSDVAQRSTPDDCWASIDGGVYDLTTWIAAHPGGAQRIIDLCGTDATSAFAGQHGGQAEPADELAALRIGSLA